MAKQQQTAAEVARRMVQAVAQGNSVASQVQLVTEEKAQEALNNFEAIEDIINNIKMQKKEFEIVLLQYFNQYEDKEVKMMGHIKERKLKMIYPSDQKRVEHEELLEFVGKEKYESLVKSSPVNTLF